MSAPDFWNVGSTLGAAVLGAAITAYFAWHQVRAARQQAQSAADQNYLNLEMASIALFRFEADHRSTVARVNSDDAPTLRELSEEDQVVLTAYLTQVLNLFELAVTFRRAGTFPPRVFATWIAWMYETCESPLFRLTWHDKFRGHYSRELADILDKGTEVLAASSAQEVPARRDLFYVHVARQFGNCPHILEWAHR